MTHSPRYRRPADVAVVEEAIEGEPSVIFLAKLPHGPLVALHGTSAMIWSEATADATGNVAPRVSKLIGDAPKSASAEIEAFLKELVNRGFLEIALSDGAI